MLKEKIIVVCGGAGFLGQAIVSEIVKNGAIAIVADVDTKSGKEFTNYINSCGDKGKATFYNLNIISSKSISSLITKLEIKYGGIDAVINNAYPRNKNYGKSFEEITYKDFCENVNLHLGGYFLIMQQFVKYFQKQKYGNIINLASIYGVIAPRFEIYEDNSLQMPIEYAAIKSSLIHLTKYLVKYLKHSNIRINCISPGGLLKNQQDKFLKKYNLHGTNKGMLDREDIVGTIVYLLSDMSKFVNGQNIIVDDGWSL